jgi:hypothetical protein
MHTHRHDPSPLTRLVHLLLLLGWLLSSHGIAPALCMAAAVIDGDHAVKVGVSKEGALTVVLSHAGKSAAELTAHEHDALCCVLVAFAAAPSPGAPDHVLAFNPVDDASSLQRLLPSLQSVAKAAPPLQASTFFRIKTSSSNCKSRQMLSCSSSQGLVLKSGRTVMRC